MSRPIVPSEFEPEESRLKDIHRFLREQGFNVVFPAYMVGEAIEPYIIVKYNGSDRHNVFHSTDLDSYGVQVYVPKNEYSQLEPLVLKVKEAMKALYPMLIPDGTVSSSYYDDSNQSHYVEVGYYNPKANRFWA